jgi:hypothetical protein
MLRVVYSGDGMTPDDWFFIHLVLTVIRYAVYLFGFLIAVNLYISWRQFVKRMAAPGGWYYKSSGKRY